MALQGTLETFSVPEVLRLLSSTRKTGLMALGGDRGMGKVWLGEGRIVAAESDQEPSGDVDSVLFDLLRFTVGEFVFEPGTEPAEQDEPTEVEAALEHAESLLREWTEIEAVVPSLDVGVRMAADIGAAVTVTPEQWRGLVAIGGGTSAARVGEDLELGELDTCRRIRDLVEAELVEITDEVPAGPVPSPTMPDETSASVESINGSLRDTIRETVQGIDGVDDTDDEVGVVDHDLSSDEVAGLGSELASFVAKPVEEPEPVSDRFEFDTEGAEEPGEESTDADWTTVGADDPGDPADDTADDFMAQLANLSPKAAAAIEATAEEEEDEAGPGEDTAAAGDADPSGGTDPDGEAGDEEINRSLLLKFLSSTKN